MRAGNIERRITREKDNDKREIEKWKIAGLKWKKNGRKERETK